VTATAIATFCGDHRPQVRHAVADYPHHGVGLGMVAEPAGGAVCGAPQPATTNSAKARRATPRKVYSCQRKASKPVNA
jgi:hypothetical protein